MQRKTIGFRRYVLTRILQAIPVLFFALILTFTIVHLAPGDPIYMFIGESGYEVDPEYLAQMMAKFALDRPLHEQFGVYIQQVLQGDLGNSVIQRVPVIWLISTRIPATLLLMGCALTFAIVLGIVLGAISAKAYRSWIDRLLTSLCLIGYSMPTFWLGTVAVLVFAIWFGLFPTGSMMTVGEGLTGFALLFDIIRHLILPTITLGSFYLSLIYRITRGNILEVLTRNFIKTARSKGLSENTVLFRHALKNAMLPILTVISLNIAFAFAGAIMTETVFSWPGMGRLLFDSLWRRDYPVIMGIFLITSIIVIVINLLTDLLYAYFDPRVRLY